MNKMKYCALRTLGIYCIPGAHLVLHNDQSILTHFFHQRYKNIDNKKITKIIHILVLILVFIQPNVLAHIHRLPLWKI